MDIFLVFVYLFTGIISGIFLGMIGIEAALFSIPILLMTGLTIDEVTLISLIVQLLPQTIPGILMYYNKNKIKMNIVHVALLILFGSSIGVYVGTTLTLNNYISKQSLYRFLAITLFISAIFVSYKYWNI